MVRFITLRALVAVSEFLRKCDARISPESTLKLFGNVFRKLLWRGGRGRISNTDTISVLRRPHAIHELHAPKADEHLKAEAVAGTAHTESEQGESRRAEQQQQQPVPSSCSYRSRSRCRCRRYGCSFDNIFLRRRGEKQLSATQSRSLLIWLCPAIGGIGHGK